MQLGARIMVRNILKIAATGLLAASSHAAIAQSGEAIALKDAIVVAVNSNPEIAQSQYHKEALQFERKLSGFAVPSRAKEVAFEAAVEEVAA